MTLVRSLAYDAYNEYISVFQAGLRRNIKRELRVFFRKNKWAKTFSTEKGARTFFQKIMRGRKVFRLTKGRKYHFFLTRPRYPVNFFRTEVRMEKFWGAKNFQLCLVNIFLYKSQLSSWLGTGQN